ncbi:MAG: phosphatase PAP2 family protein [Thermoguttaceae bacterium]
MLFWCTDLDLALVRLFFSGDATSRHMEVRWPLIEAQPWRALYNWGVYPAFVLGGGGAAVWLASFLWPRFERWRDPGLFFALLLLIGPGIFLNCLCKPYFSRPRPRDTTYFGGKQPYVFVGQRGPAEDDRSFTSGHAAMGFYLMAPAFVLYRRRPWLAAAFLGVGLASGVVIGLARIVVGGHFPSDVLWSAGLIYFTGLALAAPFHFGREKTGDVVPSPFA